jgi:hypothetical protein
MSGPSVVVGRSAIGRGRGRETGLAQIECEKIDHITFVLDD